MEFFTWAYILVARLCEVFCGFVELFEGQCSGCGRVFVWVGVEEVKCFLEAECENGGSVRVEIPGEIVTRVKACKGTVLEVSLYVKFRGAGVQP